MRILVTLLVFGATIQAFGQHGMHSQKSGYADSVNTGLIARDTMKGSPRRVEMKTISGNHIHIDYGSPGVKGRTIWGGLVAYDQVWATGAHQASTVEFSKDVTIAGKKVKTGKYAFFTIPGKNSWTLILNSRHTQHLADEYNQREDIVRVQVKPAKNPKLIQRLTYRIVPAGKNARIVLEWEWLNLSLPVTL